MYYYATATDNAGLPRIIRFGSKKNREKFLSKHPGEIILKPRKSYTWLPSASFGVGIDVAAIYLT